MSLISLVVFTLTNDRIKQRTKLNSNKLKNYKVPSIKDVGIF